MYNSMTGPQLICIKFLTVCNWWSGLCFLVLDGVYNMQGGFSAAGDSIGPMLKQEVLEKEKQAARAAAELLESEEQDQRKRTKKQEKKKQRKAAM